jgi:acyl carrier protein
MTAEEFVRLVRDESGISIRIEDLETDFDHLTGWDSVFLLKLLSALENATGGQLPVTEVLESRTLGAIHSLLVAT